ncbi:major facilitator superfamily domain-containing protein [Colletotrichum navitas]|uniref:Major facilitator superfamily domain-containing protein n=1 Tax=Colletotrichum navitas TaxID=681940 RepID=A0AAD8UZE3_9PEZI|nr:major facilitator superfamily domain-containing protein [Colletotrichum navitas]KAK1573059.1 major facilitator superfamily domain-containing protein [Colletotrichum navitas]
MPGTRLSFRLAPVGPRSGTHAGSDDGRDAANGASLLTFGKIYATLSPKRVFLVSILVSAAGSIVCAVAKTSPVFVIGRVLAGLGCAGVQVGTTLLTVSVVPLYKRPFYGGIMGTGETVAVLVGPLVAGGVTKSVGWPWCFWINLPVDVVIMASVIFLFTEKKTDPRRCGTLRLADIGKLDLPGGLLIASSTACLLVALNSAGVRNSWTDAAVLAPLLISVALFIVAAVDQHKKRDQATFPTRLLKNRHLVTNLIWLFTQAGSSIPMAYYFPIWIQGLATDSVFQAAVGIVPTLGASIVGAVVSGLLVWVIHYLPPGTIAGTVVMTVGSGLLWNLRQDSGPTSWMVFGAVFGLGNGFATQQGSVGAQAELDAKDFPAGMAAVAVVRHTSAAILIAVNQAAFLSRLSGLSSILPGFDAASSSRINRGYLQSHVSPENLDRALDIYNGALTRTFLSLMILGIVGFVTTFFLPWTSLKKPQASPDVCNELDPVMPRVRELPRLSDHDTDVIKVHYRHTIAVERNIDEKLGISRKAADRWKRAA